jgi:branched-chain amino acid transport system permease protein
MIRQLIRADVILGAIASFTVLLFGGWSGVVIGWLLGTATGLIACQARKIAKPKVGAYLGAKAGLILGIWLGIAIVFQGIVIRPASGYPALGLLMVVFLCSSSVAVATLASSLMGALQGLPETYQQQAIRMTVVFMLIAFPLVDQLAQTNWIASVVQIQIFAILALGLNITVGYAGLLDLGYAAFFAIGAYTTALLSSPQLGLDWNFWLVIWIAVAISAVAGIVLGLPTLRLRGDYLAIVTLGFGEIVPIVVRNLTQVRIDEPISKILASLLNHPEMIVCLVGCDLPIDFTGGEAGINPISSPSLPIIGSFQTANYLPWYYLVILLVTLCFLVSNRLRNSRLGRAWMAIREDELVASCMGINLVQTKLLAFAIGASFAGFAGAFYASYVGAIFPSVFGFSLSVIILCMVILGGLGNSVGVIVGGIAIAAADLLYLPQLAQIINNILNVSVLPNIASPQFRDFLATSLDPTQMRFFLFGLTLVVMMLLRSVKPTNHVRA